MADTIKDCLARAAEARAAADAEALPNARRKHILSAESWEALATKGRRLADGRVLGLGPPPRQPSAEDS